MFKKIKRINSKFKRAVVRPMKEIVLRPLKKRTVQKCFSSGLPIEIRPALEYLITKKCDSQTKEVVKNAERRRQSIASKGNKKVPIWYSPQPRADNEEISPGETKYFTMERIAKTGKSERWGTVLYLLAKAFQSRTVFELGSCAGISAMYLASAPTVETVVTVEGSKALAEMAKKSLKLYKNAHVINKLFDQALSDDLPKLEQKVDFAYIDGHHEKKATIHYMGKIVPFMNTGAIVVFDDISWSYDMREAWGIIKKNTVFSHAIDLGEIGVCIIEEDTSQNQSEPIEWNLQGVSGRHSVGEPHGWKE